MGNSARPTAQTSPLSTSANRLRSAARSALYSKYIDDAEREGGTELVEFFREVQWQDAEWAQKAKSLLGRR